jgi:hypothetical protein
MAQIKISKRKHLKMDFNSVFEELPAERKVSVGVQSADRLYYISPKFIQGYVNLDELEFIENPAFDPPSQLKIKMTQPIQRRQATTGQNINHVLYTPMDIEDDDWVY